MTVTSSLSCLRLFHFPPGHACECTLATQTEFFFSFFFFETSSNLGGAAAWRKPVSPLAYSLVLSPWTSVYIDQSPG